MVTSLPVTRALANEITRWSWQLAPFTAWLASSAISYALPRTPDQAVSAAVCDQLVSASQWLQVAGAAVRPAIGSDPVQTTDIELLRAIPSASVPQRLRPGRAEESVSELCDGITVSASRLRAAIRGSKERAKWSPSISSGGWQWMAQAAAVTSHLGELALRSLAIRAGQITGLPITAAQLDHAAECMAGMRTAWQGVDRTWDAIITESKLLQTAAMTEASDLVLRMGRLVWDNPHWTPARSDRAPQRTPAALASGPAAITSVVAAAHQAVDALARVAMTDIEAVKAADRAGRLYVPTRSLPEDENVPRPFAPASAARYRTLQDAYQAALDANMKTAQVLDKLTVATRAPSMPLALARTAASVQSHRRIRLDNDGLDEAVPAGTTPFMNSHGSTGQAGPLEQAMIDRRVSDPALLLRASAIDNAARRLLIQAESKRPSPRNRVHARAGSFMLAARPSLPPRASRRIHTPEYQPISTPFGWMVRQFLHRVLTTPAEALPAVIDSRSGVPLGHFACHFPQAISPDEFGGSSITRCSPCQQYRRCRAAAGAAGGAAG